MVHPIPTTDSMTEIRLSILSGYAVETNEYAAVLIMPDAEPWPILRRMDTAMRVYFYSISSMKPKAMIEHDIKKAPNVITLLWPILSKSEPVKMATIVAAIA